MNQQLVLLAVGLAVVAVLASAKPASQDIQAVKKRFVDTGDHDFFGPAGYRNSHLQNWQSFFDRSMRALAKRSNDQAFADPFRNPDLQNWQDTFGRYYRSGGFGSHNYDDTPFKTSNKFQDWTSMYNKRKQQLEAAKKDI